MPSQPLAVQRLGSDSPALLSVVLKPSHIGRQLLLGSCGQHHRLPKSRPGSACCPAADNDGIFFSPQNLLFRHVSMVYFSPNTVSFFARYGLLFARFFYPSAFFTPNSQHLIGPFPAHTNVTSRPLQCLHPSTPPKKPRLHTTSSLPGLLATSLRIFRAWRGQELGSGRCRPAAAAHTVTGRV